MHYDPAGGASEHVHQEVSHMRIIFAALATLALLIIPASVSAVPTGQAKIVPQGANCVRISTAGVDHGEDVAQKYADDLLKADIDAFKKRKGLSSVRIQRRFKKCKYHLWFFGNEYNCTSLAVVCW
jgi:hypothetical protein